MLTKTLPILSTKPRLILLTAFLVASLFIFSHSIAHAASQDITITPAANSIYMNPGSTYKGSLQVINQGKASYKFIVYASPYHVKGEDYTPDFTLLPTAPDTTSWFTLSQPSGYISPGQSIKINYTITMPENIQAGSYYAAVFAETQFPKKANSITLNERVGELFYVQANGPLVKKGAVKSWGSKFLQKQPLTSELKIEDSGSTFFPASVRVNIKDILGHTKYSLYSVKEILPQTTRRITISWAKAPSIGLFKVSGNVNFLNQNHVLGTQWVLVVSPVMRIVAIIIFVLLVLLIIFGPRRKHRSKHKKRRRI